MNKMSEQSIPVQYTGAETDTESAFTAKTPALAAQVYNLARQRLIDVNGWTKLSGKAGADFKLFDQEGTAIDRTAGPGDHIRIDIPGPGPGSGDGFDWVQIESIEDVSDAHAPAENIIIKVRPSASPLNQDTHVAHFYTSESSSNFIVRREGLTVTAGVYGRNEKPNVSGQSLADTVRNGMIAISAFAGISTLQWKSLTEGLLGDHKDALT